MAAVWRRSALRLAGFLVLEVTVGYAHTLKIYNGGLEHFVDHINRQIFDNYDAL